MQCACLQPIHMCMYGIEIVDSSFLHACPSPMQQYTQEQLHGICCIIWPSFAPHIFLYCMPLHKGILYTAALDIYAWEPPNISYKLVRVAYSFNNVHIFKAKGIQYVHYIHRGRGLLLLQIRVGVSACRSSRKWQYMTTIDICIYASLFISSLYRRH